jgi:hypothetical protein
MGIGVDPATATILSAASQPTLAKNARMGHPQFECCKQNSKAGHPPKKLGHATSQGFTSAFQGVEKGSAAAAVRDIMSNPARVVRGGMKTDVYNAAGQGVRFENGTGKFITFLEASQATR